MDDKLLEPLKYYKGQGKDEHHGNVEAHFNKLVETSKVNVEENQKTVKEWEEKQEEIGTLSKIIGKFKIFRALLILGIIVGAILTIVSFGQFSDSVVVGILLLVLGLGAFIASITVMVKKVNPVIKNTDMVRQERIAEADELEKEGWAQMQALNDLFTDEDACRLIEKTLPDFSFEEKFSVEQEKLFYEKYDFLDVQTDECSMLDTLSGKYAGNPFLFGRRRVHKMGTHTYTGSLRITWTETYRDSEGNIKTRQKSETLRASTTKPKPYYSTNTFLAYGNQAAPDLTFSRTSKHVEKLSEKALEKQVHKGEKKLQKQAKKAVKAGGNFQEMANTDFDVLFGATDRDNEVQFRIMYTPIAQRSTVELLKDSDNYGDDFDFIKAGKCNFIYSDHAQSWKMKVFADDYKHFDFEEIKARFTTLNDNYFRSIFFDFAPFFCVPVYLDEPCASLESGAEYKANYTYYEHEVMANAIGYQSFEHEDSCTEAILKTETVTSENGSDLILVTANSYMGLDRIDYIPVKGGDGNYHDVPVPWIEYVPISKTSQVRVANSEENSDDLEICYHGLAAGIVNK